MTLSFFVRNVSYFQNIRNMNNLITGDVLDKEFEKISRYINNKIEPIVNNLLANKLSGIIGGNGYLLKNVGDKTTVFSKIKDNDIPQNTITIEKLAKIPPVSIVVHKANLDFITYVNRNETLLNDGINHYFNKITANHIKNNSISAIKIRAGTLNENHLNIALLNAGINGILPITKIINNALTDNKIANNAYSDDKISNELNNDRDETVAPFVLQRKAVTGLINDANIIKNRHIANNSINFFHLFGNNRILANNVIVNNSIVIPQTNTLNIYSFFKDGRMLTLFHILNNSFGFTMYNNVKPNINKRKINNQIKQKLMIGGLV